jgi:rRNA maturation endonuclease Nob1
MLYDIIMWFYASMALMVGALLWFHTTREKPHVYPPEWVCDGCGQVCSELKEGFCEYCEKQLAK